LYCIVYCPLLLLYYFHIIVLILYLAIDNITSLNIIDTLIFNIFNILIIIVIAFNTVLHYTAVFLHTQGCITNRIVTNIVLLYYISWIVIDITFIFICISVIYCILNRNINRLYLDRRVEYHIAFSPLLVIIDYIINRHLDISH